MVGTNGLPKLLKLEDYQVPVEIAGRSFLLKQQAKPALLRILNAMFDQDKVRDEEIAEEPAAEDNTLEENVAEAFMKEWDRSVPIITMILGYCPEKEDEYNDVIQFVTNEVPPMFGVKIFHTWWQLNEITSFFGRMGRTLMHPEQEQALEAIIAKRTQMAVDEIVQEVVSGG